MNVKHPDGKRTIVMVDRLEMIGDISTCIEETGWVTIGYVGSDRGLLVDIYEWEAFVNLVSEIDVIIKENKNGN